MHSLREIKTFKTGFVRIITWSKYKSHIYYDIIRSGAYMPFSHYEIAGVNPQDKLQLAVL